MAGNVSNGATLKISDYRDLQRELRKIEPKLIARMRANVREDAEPIRQAIRSNIPGTAPLHGMVTPIGRLAWGAGKPAKSATFSMRAPKKNLKRSQVSLARIIVGSAATVMSDMAGRSNKYIGARKLAAASGANAMEVTRGKYKGQMGYAYTYKSGISGRIHRNNGAQGRGMIRKLNAVAGRSASHFVWPAAEKGLPAAQRKIQQTLEQYFSTISNDLRSK